MIVFFSIAEPHTFPSFDNFKSIVANQSVAAVLAMAVLAPLIVGEFDLSVGGAMSLAAVVSASLVSHGTPVALAIPLVLAIGAAVGLINAVLIVRIGLSSFVATLGMATVLAGLSRWISDNSTVYENIGRDFTQFGNVVILGFLPIQGLYVLVLAGILLYVFAFTPFGRELYATGSGRQAARLAGIPTDRRIFLAFVLSGVLAAFAGTLNAAQLGSAAPGVGEAFLLPAYAGAFLGATTIVVGRFNVIGTLVGIALLAVGITGLQLMGAANFVSDLFNGLALIVAVSVARLGARRASRTA
jgi:ribose transport system permease protein